MTTTRKKAGANRCVLLFLWNEKEAAARAGTLEGAGYEVTAQSAEGGNWSRDVRDDPPDLFVIDLNRLPSHGRAVGVWLRQQKATRMAPIVFVEGDADKTALTRRMMPDAVYTDWKKIRSAVRGALANPPEKPVVPGTMDGYAGTPLPRKLGIKEGSVVALPGAPAGFEKTLGKLPPDVRIKKTTRGTADVIMLFAGSQADLNKRFAPAKRALVQGGRLWICWPKKTSGVKSDLTQAVVRAFGLGSGLVDYKISAIDKTWSGLCFTQRRAKKK